MQRLVKCCLRAAFSSAVLELPTKGTQAPRAACGYGALVRQFTAYRFSAAAGDALRVQHALYTAERNKTVGLEPGEIWFYSRRCIHVL
jgi:hypothetical protein